jgi:hypothetical protein
MIASATDVGKNPAGIGARPLLPKRNATLAIRERTHNNPKNCAQRAFRPGVPGTFATKGPARFGSHPNSHHATPTDLFVGYLKIPHAAVSVIHHP